MLTEYNGQAITYDEVGNPLSYRDGITMTWQKGRELATLTKDNKTISYTYDANGIRSEKNNNGTVTKYFYDSNNNLISLKQGDTQLVFYYDSEGQPESVAHYTNYVATRYYYVKNLQGDVTKLLADHGTVIANYEYDAYGKLLSVTNASGVEITSESSIALLNPLRYRGYVYDRDTELYYVASRYYDPDVGRWISPEPNLYLSEFDDESGLLRYNVFIYCSNNPVMFMDKTGEGITLICVLIGAGVGLVVGSIGGSHYAKHKKYLSPSDGWDYWKYVVGFGVAGGAVGALVGWGAGALIAKYGVSTAATSIAKGGGARFSSFDALKRSMGSAGKGKQWHHIVEQCQIQKSGFSKYWIHNSNNVVNISNSVHSKISAHYSSKIPGLTGGKTVRNWLAGQSFKKQYEYGVKILRQFGVKI